jgi:transcriptional regulator with XRE-family HTH domain
MITILTGILEMSSLRLRFMTSQEIGDTVRFYRAGMGVTQRVLAEKTGIARPNIARLEAGRHSPTLDTIGRIARALGVEPQGLIITCIRSEESDAEI